MAWLSFDRRSGDISLFGGPPPSDPRLFVGPPIGRWSAHNETASTSGGAWPSGVYSWSHYNEHAEAGLSPGCFRTSYGCDGIHVFSVPGRAGMGVHGGRTFGQSNKVGGKTLGCIRVPADAMEAINRVHQQDRLVKIVVSEE
jgi:hypothetical protein